MKRNSIIYFIILVITIFISAGVIRADQPIDTLIFGDSESENSHTVSTENSEIMKGAMDEPVRRLKPISATDWQGGRIDFTLKVDPVKPNYLTIRLWGSDTTTNRLILYADGKQIGYRHLGDYDILDNGTEQPFYNGRFFYITSPLPENLTQGKNELRLEIRSTGLIWGYGTNFAQYQKPMTEPTRELYRVYTHTDGYFTPPKDEKQCEAPKNIPIRKSPGAEVLTEVKERVNKTIDGLLNSPKPLNQMQMVLLATSYHVKWTNAYQNKKVIEKVVEGLDAIFAAYRQNPKVAEAAPATDNADWLGLGPSGQVISLLGEPLKSFIDKEIDDNDKKTTRRSGFTEMLIASRDWHKLHRRSYTNQSMIIDLNIYRANRGIAVLDSSKANSEKTIRRYLYEAVGLETWRDSDPEFGSSNETLSKKDSRVGNDYRLVTEKGLTRELGFVGNYGEVIDLVGQIYDATRNTPDAPGDEKIKAQLEKIVRARSFFRYSALDPEGNLAMRSEVVVGWRDNHFPGEVVYGERSSRGASALYAAALTLDPEAIGHVQQMLADNQFFYSIKEVMKENTLRVTQGLLGIPGEFELLKKQSPSSIRMPMTDGQPDFVFSDEEDGVIAVKNGSEILYISLYWRARNAINFLARVHYMTPQVARFSTVREEVEFERSGLFYTRPDWTNFGFANGGLKYPGEFHSAHAGEKLPIAKIPADVAFKPGDENMYAGRGDFYKLRYGKYLIAMNMTKGKSFELQVPDDFKTAIELVSKKAVKEGEILKIAPRSTVVLYLK